MQKNQTPICLDYPLTNAPGCPQHQCRDSLAIADSEKTGDEILR